VLDRRAQQPSHRRSARSSQVSRRHHSRCCRWTGM